MICKVDALNFPITFYDPFNTETGFCVPDQPCHSLLDKAKITKNNSQHEYIFTIPLEIQLNGRWICTYGDNNEKAATEVTIQDIPSTNGMCNFLYLFCNSWIIGDPGIRQ